MSQLVSLETRPAVGCDTVQEEPTAATVVEKLADGMMLPVAVSVQSNTLSMVQTMLTCPKVVKNGEMSVGKSKRKWLARKRRHSARVCHESK
jgi:hypothetical protein